MATGAAEDSTAPAVQDGLPPLIPIQHFFDNPEIAGAQISPDARRISYLKPYRDKLNIFVRELGSDEERRVTADTVRPVQGYFWSVDGDRILYVQDKGGNENFHVYSVPLAGAGVPEATDLTPFENVRAFIFAVPDETPDRILVGLNRRDPSLFDAYWLDLESGELTMAAENPGNFGGMLLDHEQKVRLGVGQGPSGETIIYTRASEDAEWEEAARYPAEEQANPIRFHEDNRRIWMNTNHGTDLARLALLDPETGELETVESDPEGEVDLGSAIFSDLTEELMATVYVGDTVRIYPKTEELEQDLAAIRRVHPGEPNIQSMSRDERKLVVSFDDPTDPGVTYLFDRETDEAEFLYRSRPWLEEHTLAGMEPISFPSRDGLEIHGYLTLPPGVEAENLPMVLLVHGGPWARDTWGYDSEAQLLANRGYAVLQVNYRGSTGYGKEFYNAAVGEFAGKMHDDLVDGVRWAVERGIADPERVAIYGGSYGGYATLVGLTFTPEVFACGVDYVGPSSLITLIESFPPYWRPFLEGTWYRFVGDPQDPEDRAELEAKSPLNRVDRIEDPLLIVQGANDPRVTKRESDQMAIALRDRGVKVEYLVAPNEGHGFANADNRMALYRSMETFLGECLGGRVQEDVPREISSKIAELTVDVDTLTLEEEEEVAYTEVRPGDEALDLSGLEADTDTLQLLLSQGGQEQPIGTATEEVSFIEVDGTPAIRRVQVIRSAMANQTDTVVVERETLRPIRYSSRNAQRTVELTYEDGTITGATTPANGEARPVDATPERPLFDANAAGLVLRALPLKEGYAARIPVYSVESGGSSQVEARVVGTETVATSGGEDVQAWRLEGTAMGQEVTWWVAKEGGEIVKQVLSPAPGVEVIVRR